MQWLDRNLVAEIHFVDREGTRDAIRLYFAPTSNLGALFNALCAESAWQAVSDCQQYAVTLMASSTRIDDGVATGSNLNVGALLFHSAADTYSAFTIPGIKAAVLERSGCYAGAAINIGFFDVQQVANELISAGACTPRGDALDELEAGTVRQQWSPLIRRSG